MWKPNGMEKASKVKKQTKRYYRKRVELTRLLEKIKLWPSRRGILHGIKSIEIFGSQAEVITHCCKTFLVNNSRNSRAARWLRNKWYASACTSCAVPEWKIKKYSLTQFKRHQGSRLDQGREK
jgi:pyrrolysyl-tRNA synthetase-like protein